MAQVPELSPEWPPTAAQLATLLTTAHWQMADVAYDLPRGALTRDQLVEFADGLAALAKLLRNHEPVNPDTEEIESARPVE